MKKRRSAEDKRFRELAAAMVDRETEWIRGMEPSDHNFSQTFQDQMSWNLLRRRRKQIWRKSVQGIAAAAASAAVILLLTNPALVVRACQSILEWGTSMVDVRYRGERDEDYVVPQFELTYIPEGYELEEENYIEDIQIGECIYVSDTDSFSFTYVPSDGALSFNDEYVTKQEIYLENGTIVYYLESHRQDYYSSVTWLSQDNNVTFNLLGNLSKDEFIKVIEGIKEK